MASWFEKRRYSLLRAPALRDRIPEGLCTKCATCGEIVLTRDMAENLNVCPQCDHHHRLTAAERIEQIVDPGTFVESNAGVTPCDPLGFPKYREQTKGDKERTGMNEAVMTGRGCVHGIEVSLAVMDFHFRGGSMNSGVGEKIARAFECSLEHKIPALVFSASGGARMQEGILSLLQMAKTSALVGKLHAAGVPYISVLTDPTGAGVAASFALQGDLVLAEPKALIYFAGPLVIEQTIQQVLPKGFQLSEFVQEHGFIDRIVPRSEMKDTVADLLSLLTGHEVQRVNGSAGATVTS